MSTQTVLIGVIAVVLVVGAAFLALNPLCACNEAEAPTPRPAATN